MSKVILYARRKGYAIVATLEYVVSRNIAKDRERHDPADCLQMQPMVETLVTTKKPSVDLERFPVQFCRDLGRLIKWIGSW
ncbi:MAG: hypothetical protein H5T34_06305 [Candidatus Methanomethyliales bacterium]|nr:hypothetical protein [Candidatus Methanomethylicales archaeon]